MRERRGGQGGIGRDGGGISGIFTCALTVRLVLTATRMAKFSKTKIIYRKGNISAAPCTTGTIFIYDN